MTMHACQCDNSCYEDDDDDVVADVSDVSDAAVVAVDQLQAVFHTVNGCTWSNQHPTPQ